MVKCIYCDKKIDHINEGIPEKNICVDCFTRLLKNPDPFVRKEEEEIKRSKKL
jgi:hypothetical protein